MKHGRVTNGRTTTFYGDDAQVELARMWVTHCFSRRECAKWINEQTLGVYRDAMIEWAKRLGMVVDAKKRDRVKAAPRREGEP